MLQIWFWRPSLLNVLEHQITEFIQANEIERSEKQARQRNP